MKAGVYKIVSPVQGRMNFGIRLPKNTFGFQNFVDFRIASERLCGYAAKSHSKIKRFRSN